MLKFILDAMAFFVIFVALTPYFTFHLQYTEKKSFYYSFDVCVSVRVCAARKVTGYFSSQESHWLLQ